MSISRATTVGIGLCLVLAACAAQHHVLIVREPEACSGRSWAAQDARFSGR